MTWPCTQEQHDAAKASDAAWAELEPRGTQSIDFGDGGEIEHYLCANCRTCHSTLYRRVDATAVVAAVRAA